ncbi:MAG: transcription antitermination factor NusB [Brevibacterium aurantiacum]|uniref:Transcription antitermination protein NusB n=2 Tax=Brevibacterium aurantiacum TaxID=273384 RepID=A0A2A3Z6X4_BREAU|nr:MULTISPECIES: transcription antitermination factor NusB [Brevibacterium]MDN5592816.1 transcription antitermination factor NusB [Brevibacterium sp.]AZL06020.1 transcription antitermination factor NusB [Brevibacterium aurantiacum]AZL09581.1 transcription antitermination factor NusB [Brevibacterium aurantiacum]AZL13215.1 transcription antitermination factor NusB [Brevibacterium aurantiacum]AZT93709.1 transcription antitermination factor NusB [Brevibacterium aurantiacum]
MSARTRARRRALELMFEAGQRRLDTEQIVTMRSNDPDYPMKAYAVEIVEGITSHREEIDEIIATYAEGWTLERMPAVDLALLQIGTWEIIFNDEVPDKAAIDEAVSLARQFSTDDSPGFISGLLSRVLDVKPTLI